MVNGNKLYTDAIDLGVSGRVFYVKSGALYSDAATTVAADGGRVFQAFLAGILTIVDGGGVIYNATSVILSSSTVTVTYGTQGSATATVAAGDTKTAEDYAAIVPA